MGHGEHTESHSSRQMEGAINADLLHAEMVGGFYDAHDAKANRSMIDCSQTERAKGRGKKSSSTCKRKNTSPEDDQQWG